MVVKSDRYTKFVLTIIALALLGLLFKPQVQQSLTPPSAQALSKLPGVMDDSGNQIILTDVNVRNTESAPVQVKSVDKIQVYWDKPLPVYIVDMKKEK